MKQQHLNSFGSPQLVSQNNSWTPKQLLILKAATCLFAEKGYANTSTREIAQQAAVSEGSIFRGFKTKEQLLMSILKPVIEGVLANMFAETTQKESARRSIDLSDFITMIVEDRTAFIKAHIAVFKILIEEILYDKVIRLEIIKKLPQPFLVQINQIITQLHLQKKIVDWDNQEIIRFIVNNVLGFVLNYFILFDKSTIEIESAQHHLIEFLTKGLAFSADV